jgi:hypothetical protein
MNSSSRIYSNMIDDLVRDLTGRSDVRRASAVERCEGLPEDLLLDIISRLLAQYHKQAAWRWAEFLLGAVGIVSFAYIIQGNMLFVYGVLGLAVARHLQLTYRHTGRSLQGMLQNSEDKRLIPILLLKYSAGDGSGLRPQLTRVRDLGLTQLLPYVTQSDDEMWTPAMRARLAALLGSRNRNEKMLPCVLHALSQIGDKSALPNLLPLTLSDSEHYRGLRLRDRRSKTPGVRDAAIRCVDAIGDRVNRRVQQSVLLRPSATETPLSISLPRPVDGDYYQASLELTRPASQNNSQ